MSDRTDDMEDLAVRAWELPVSDLVSAYKDPLLEAVDALAVALSIGANGLMFTWDQLEALNRVLRVHAHELAEKQRAHTAADYAHVLSAYGFAYANGWRAGRDRAAELIEEVTD